MKKLLLTCLTLSFITSGMSQNDDAIYSLIEVRSSDDLEHEIYTYNSDRLLTATDILLVDGIEVRDSLHYDAFNNISKLDRYQLLNTGWTHVSYIEYTYDEDGNRVSRSNYNSFGGPTFDLGGVYNYSYENGKQTGWELYMGGTDLTESATLTYNSNGQLLEELVQSSWTSGPMENSWKMDYEYNSDGTLSTSKMFFWNGASWDYSAGEWFDYDDNKNCIKWDHKVGNTVTSRNLYEYDINYTIDQLVFPINPETGSYGESLVEMNNKVVLKNWYTQNDNGALIYICDFIYTYELMDTMGVPDLSASVDNIRFFPNPASDIITVSSDKTSISNIDVLDNTGRIVLNVSNVNKNISKLDVSELSSGVYYVRLATTRGVVTEKIVKQ